MDQETLAELQALEESLWRAATRFDEALMDKTFAPDLFEFGRSGRVYTRDELLIARGDAREIAATLPLPEFRARYLSEHIAQVTYVSEEMHDGRVEFGNRSSIWRREDGTWRLMFHQGTPAPERM